MPSSGSYLEQNNIRSALFWDITRRRVVIVYRSFFLALEDGTNTLSRNVGKQLRLVISQKSADLINMTAENLKNEYKSNTLI
jgi:hypothetical protein